MMPVLVTSSGQEIDPTKLSFTLAELIKFSGASRTKINDWIEQKIILAPQSTKQRNFTFWNVFEAATADNFCAFMDIRYLQHVIEELRERFFQPPDPSLVQTVKDSKKIYLKNKLRTVIKGFPEICRFVFDENLSDCDSHNDYVVMFYFWDFKQTKNTFQSSVYIAPYSLLCDIFASIATDRNTKSNERPDSPEAQIVINISRLYRQIVYRIWKALYDDPDSKLLTNSSPDAIVQMLEDSEEPACNVRIHLEELEPLLKGSGENVNRKARLTTHYRSLAELHQMHAEHHRTMLDAPLGPERQPSL